MTILADAFNENIWGEDYLHYSATGGKEKIQWAIDKISQSKSQIMLGQRSQMNARYRNKANALSQAKINNIEALLDGSIFDTINNAGGVEKSQLQDIDLPSTLDEARAQATKVDEGLNDFEIFANEIERMTSQLTGIQTSTLKGYAAQIVANAANSHTKIASYGGTIGQSILEAVLAKHSHDFFRMQEFEGQNLDTNLAKILAVIGALRTPNIGGTTYHVAHDTTSNVVGTASSNSEIIQELSNKIADWATQLDKNTAEAATLKGVEKAMEVGKIANDSIKASLTGTSNVKTHFKPDPKVEKNFELAKKDINSLLSKRAKSDVSLTLTDNGAITQWGFSVKKYGNVKTMDDGSTIVGGNIELQNGTPLLTAIAREAGISGDNLTNIYQLLVAHGDETYSDAELTQTWEELKQYLLYRMFLNVLAGFQGTQDEVTYLVINGYIYTLRDFFNSFVNSDSTLSMLEKQNVEGGLLRDTYVAMNEWVGDQRHNPAKAKSRSWKTHTSVVRTMAATKLRIQLNIANMKNLL